MVELDPNKGEGQWVTNQVDVKDTIWLWPQRVGHKSEIVSYAFWFHVQSFPLVYFFGIQYMIKMTVG